MKQLQTLEGMLSFTKS